MSVTDNTPAGMLPMKEATQNIELGLAIVM